MSMFVLPSGFGGRRRVLARHGAHRVYGDLEGVGNGQATQLNAWFGCLLKRQPGLNIGVRLATYV